MVIIETVEQFDELINENKTLVAFYANWCGPCKMLAPILEKLDSSFPNLVFAKIDVDKLPTLATRYYVSAIPTLILFEAGKIVEKNIGYLPENKLIDWITSIENDKKIG